MENLNFTPADMLKAAYAHFFMGLPYNCSKIDEHIYWLARVWVWKNPALFEPVSIQCFVDFIWECKIFEHICAETLWAIFEAAPDNPIFYNIYGVFAQKKC